MTAAPALSPSRLAPFLLASAPSPARAWMLKPATLHADGLAWTIATDGASLYAEPGEQGHPSLTDEAIGVEPLRALEDILRRAAHPGVPMLPQDREALRLYACKPNAAGAVHRGGARYDAGKIRAALEVLADSPWLAEATTPFLSRVPRPVPLDVRQGLELMIWGDRGRVVVLANC